MLLFESTMKNNLASDTRKLVSEARLFFIFRFLQLNLKLIVMEYVNAAKTIV